MRIKVTNNFYDIKYCTKLKDRFMGMMFLIKKIDYGYCFPKCNSIHTFFMFQNIDIYMTDINGKIIYIYKNIKPFRIILPKKHIYYTYEFVNKNTNFKKNDIIELEKV